MANVPAKSKATRKPRVPKAPPTMDQLTTVGKQQLTKIQEVNTSLVESFKGAGDVPVGHLRYAKKMIAEGIAAHLKTLKVDPVVRKKNSLLKRIAKAQALLKELEEA